MRLEACKDCRHAQRHVMALAAVCFLDGISIHELLTLGISPREANRLRQDAGLDLDAYENAMRWLRGYYAVNRDGAVLKDLASKRARERLSLITRPPKPGD